MLEIIECPGSSIVQTQHTHLRDSRVYCHVEERFIWNFCLLMIPSLIWWIFLPFISQQNALELCWCFLLCLDIINYCHAKSFQLFWVGWLFYLCVAFMFGNLYLKWAVCLSYVDISFHIGCYIDFCISFLCHVFRSYSTCFFEIRILFVLRKFSWFPNLFCNSLGKEVPRCLENFCNLVITHRNYLLASLYEC